MRCEVLRTLAVLLALTLSGATGGSASATSLADSLVSFDAWTMEDGLPQNYVYTLTATRDGVLWLGTQEGAARFDGLRFRTFNAASDAAFRHASVSGIAETRDGTLWIGTPGGLLMRDGTGIVPAPDAFLAEASISLLLVDVQGRLWIGTDDAGLYVREAGAFRSIAGLPKGHYVTFIAQASDGTTWIATFSHGIYRVAPGAGAAEALAGFPAGTVQSLAADPSGSIFASVRDVGIVEYRVATGDTRSDPRFAGIEATTMKLDGERRLWLGTKQHGILVRDGDAFRTLPHSVERSPQVLDIAFDASGALWVGTRAGGLQRYRRGPIAALTTADGLSSNEVITVCEDKQGAMWVGGQDGRVTRIAGSRVDVFEIPGNAHEVRAVYPRDDAGVWVGSYGSGLFTIDADGHAAPAVARPDDALPRYVKGLMRDAEGTLWVGGVDGLARLRDGVATRVFDTRFGITKLGLDPGGRVLIGTFDHGVGTWDGNAVRFPVSPSLASVEALGFLSHGGATWLSTNNRGLIRFDGTAADAWRQRDGVPTDNAAQLLADDAGRLWVCSNSGLFYLELAQLQPGAPVTPVPFGIADGMPTLECNNLGTPAAWRTSKGLLWYATVGGVAIVDPARVPTAEPPPRVTVESVLSEETPMPVGPTVHLTKGSGRMTVRYFAAALDGAHRIVYQYRLDGLDEDWIDAGARREAFYTNLSPGSYLFRVRARRVGDVQASPEATVDVVVPGRFYQYTAFWVALGALAFAMVALIHHLRLHALQLSNELLDERNRVAREIHDTLGQDLSGIAMQLQAAKRAHDVAPERAFPLLELAETRLRRSLEDTRRAIQALRPTALAGSDLPSALRAAITEWTSDGTIVEFSSSGVARPLPDIVEINLLRLAQEGVRNALVHAGARRIAVGCEFFPRDVRVTVLDDGAGIGIVPPAPGHGFGLAAIQERAAAIGARAEITSVKGGGTRVAVTWRERRGPLRWLRRLVPRGA